MASYTIPRNNFSAGQIGPHVLGRTEIPAYANGCKRLENFLITKLGSIRRRPGSYYVIPSPGPVRLIPWQLPDGSTVIIELSANQARFITTEGEFLAGSVTTVWSNADLPGLRYSNVKGILYLVHPSYRPQTFSYSAGTVTVAQPSFSGMTFTTAGNYPANIAFYAGRLWFQGTANNPRGLWASRTFDPATYADRFTDFTVPNPPDPDDGIYIVESAIGAKPLSWLEPMLTLCAGGEQSIWQQNGSATPGEFDMRVCSAQGSYGIQARAFGSFIIYTGADGKSLYALAYSQDGGGYGATELSFASRNLLTSGIKEFDVAQTPDPIIWVITNDGKILTYHLDQGAGLAGFSVHTITGATVESVAVARRGIVDRAYLSVNRGGARSVEFIDPVDYTSVGPDDDSATPGGMHYVDSGVYYKESSPTTTFSGLSHLEGLEVDALGDGAVMPRRTVTLGAVTYDRSVSRIHIGLPMQSLVQPTSPEIPTLGSGQGKKRRVEKLTIRVVDSYGGKIGRDETHLEALPDFKYGTTVYGAAPVLFSGDKERAFPGVSEEELAILVVQDVPLPFHLLALFPQIRIDEA